MKDIITVDSEKCVGCNVCVRSCPAPEANIIKKLDSGKTVVSVNTSKCIACGECVKACSHGARDYVDDTEDFMSRLSSEKMIVMADPAIKTAFPTQWKGILDWFRKKGCQVYDASLGADICTWALLSAVDSGKCRNIISHHCPAVMNYVKLYQPSLQKNLAPIYSPAVCMAIYIKNYLNKSGRIALLSPCIACKLDSIDTGLVEFNITFRNLMDYFLKNHIVIRSENYADYDYSFDDKAGQMGSLFSRPAGLCDSIHYYNADVRISSSSGSPRVYSELELYSRLSESKLPQVFDVLSCEYGCSLGVGAGSIQTPFDVSFAMSGLENSIRNKMNKSKSKGMFRGGDDKLFMKFDEELELDDFLRSYRSSKSYAIPTPAELAPVFESMNKLTNEDKRRNCGACGFKTCSDLAAAIFRGLASPDACICMQGGGEKPADNSNELAALSEKMEKCAAAISESLNNISISNTAISEKVSTVNDLLKNIVSFCGSNSTMDEKSVAQMIKILETTIKSLDVFYDSTSSAKENSEIIGNSLKEMDGLIKDMKAVG